MLCFAILMLFYGVCFERYASDCNPNTRLNHWKSVLTQPPAIRNKLNGRAIIKSFNFAKSTYVHTINQVLFVPEKFLYEVRRGPCRREYVLSRTSLRQLFQKQHSCWYGSVAKFCRREPSYLRLFSKESCRKKLVYISHVTWKL